MTTQAAAIYMRVSTDEQVDGTSLLDQKERNTARAVSMGLDVVGVYEDAGISGATALADRPEGARLLADAAAGKFSTIIVAKLDRFSRNLANGANDLARLTQLGVGVVFLDLGIDTSTPAGKLMLDVMLAFASFERDTIQGRMSSGQYQTAMAGRWPAGRVPYGYSSNQETGQIEIVEDEAAVLRFIFDHRAEGASMSDISKMLNESDYRPRPKIDQKATKLARQKNPDAEAITMASNFRPSSLALWVSPDATHLMGAGISRDVKVPESDEMRTFVFDAPAIIDPATWQAAVGTTLDNKPSRSGNREHFYGLSERVTHLHADGTTAKTFGQSNYKPSKTGHLIQVDVTPKGAGRKLYEYPEAPDGVQGTHTVNRFYRCEAARADDVRPAYCTGFGGGRSSVSADRVEASALHWMLTTLEDTDAMERYLQAASQTLVEAGADPDSVPALKKAQAKALRKRTIWADQFAEGILTEDEWTQRKAIADAEIAAIVSRLDAAKSAQSWLANLEGGMQALLSGKVEWTAEGQAIHDEIAEDHEPMTSEKLHIMLGHISRAVTPMARGKTGTLPLETVEEVYRLANLLGLQVVLTARGEWTPDDSERLQTQDPAAWPNMAFTFAPEQVLQSSPVSGATR